MDIQAEKIELVKLLLNTHNPSVISAVKSLLNKESTTDFWDDLSEGQKDEIHQADIEIKNGKTADFKSFIDSHRR